MKTKAFIAAVLSLCIAAACNAQLAPENNPIVKAANLVGEKGLPKIAKQTKSPTVFKASPDRSFIKAYIEKSFDSDKERQAVFSVFSDVFKSFDSTAKGAGFADDASAAYAFAVSLLVSIGTGKELNEEAFPVLIGEFQTYFDQPGIQKATDKQKEEAYQYALCSVGSIVVYASTVKTEQDQEKVKLAALLTLKNLLGVEIEQITLKGTETTIKGTASDTQSSGGTAPGFSFEIPQGWVKETTSPWYASRVYAINGRDLTSALIRFMPAVPAKGSFSDAIRKAWKEGVPAELADKASGMVFRRYIGDGLFTQFIFGKGVEKDRKYQSLYSVYLIDCGSTWQPVVVAQVWDPAGGSSPGGDMSAGFSFPTSADLAEVMMKTFKCPSAKGKPIADKSAIVGDYSYGTQSQLQWENIYTGASTMTFVSFGGTLNLKADGTFTYTFASASGQVGATKFGSAKGHGTWSIQGDLLITKYLDYDQGDSYKRTEETFRISGVVSFSDGSKVSVLAKNLKKPINACTVADNSDYYTTKKKD
ncbi:MAG: DUF6683 family protein [Armatimonadota bacterium]